MENEDNSNFPSVSNKKVVAGKILVNMLNLTWNFLKCDKYTCRCP